MEHKQLKIYNGRIITPFRIIEKGSVLVSGSTITAVSEENLQVNDAIEIDAQGRYVSPGFIDIHVHGGGGCDFMDGSVDAFLKVAETHAKYGTTAMVPTTLTSTKEELLHTLDLYDQADKKNISGAQFLGMHLEGPYFAMNQRGAQDPRYIRNPDPEEYVDILSRSNSIRRWSAAPELEGAIAFGKYLRSKGILPAIAHTDAVYKDVLIALENGFTLATHLYSGMSGVTRRNAFRYAGVIESALLLDGIDVEVIADGRHLPEPLLKLIYKVKGPERIALITDAMRGAGMPEGESVLGNYKTGLKVIVEDGVAKLPDRTSFAGSVATTDRLLRTMVNVARVPLADAVKMLTYTPARIMGISDIKGSLVAGKEADIVIFDEHIQVSSTIIRGKVVFQK